MRLALDVALAACFVAVMATALVQEAPHEYLGLATCVLTVAHVVVNRRRVVALVRGRKTARSIATAAIDAAVLLCIVAMFGSALVLSKHAFGFLPALPGAAVARQVHMGCSYWLFALVAVHAGMHVRVWDARRNLALTSQVDVGGVEVAEVGVEKRIEHRAHLIAVERVVRHRQLHTLKAQPTLHIL